MVAWVGPAYVLALGRETGPGKEDALGRKTGPRMDPYCSGPECIRARGQRNGRDRGKGTTEMVVNAVAWSCRKASGDDKWRLTEQEGMQTKVRGG